MLTVGVDEKQTLAGLRAGGVLVDPGESLRSLDGLDELLPQLLVTLVRGQVQTVKTGSRTSEDGQFEAPPGGEKIG